MRIRVLFYVILFRGTCHVFCVCILMNSSINAISFYFRKVITFSMFVRFIHWHMVNDDLLSMLFVLCAPCTIHIVHYPHKHPRSRTHKTNNLWIKNNAKQRKKTCEHGVVSWKWTASDCVCDLAITGTMVLPQRENMAHEIVKLMVHGWQDVEWMSEIEAV